MKVMEFINHFTDESKNEQMIKALSGEYSYWFASILYKRFIKDQAMIVFDISTKCFGTKIGDNVYDIRGDVTNLHEWILWKNVPEEMRNEIKSEQDLF